MPEDEITGLVNKVPDPHVPAFRPAEQISPFRIWLAEAVTRRSSRRLSRIAKGLRPAVQNERTRG
jgi:hypothetical protein